MLNTRACLVRLLPFSALTWSEKENLRRKHAVALLELCQKGHLEWNLISHEELPAVMTPSDRGAVKTDWYYTPNTWMLDEFCPWWCRYLNYHFGPNWTLLSVQLLSELSQTPSYWLKSFKIPCVEGNALHLSNPKCYEQCAATVQHSETSCSWNPMLWSRAQAESALHVLSHQEHKEIRSSYFSSRATILLYLYISVLTDLFFGYNSLWSQAPLMFKFFLISHTVWFL